ncbi:MAG: tRNA epoxyqueuosine(34) reductase QueG [Gammaproteobacteria bacterium]|nr:tRNA epoxyqueuosine(34) reductase QueG [Gammaproteobacteria bacterium]
MQSLMDNIRDWGLELGFDHIGVSDTSLAEHEVYLMNWLQSGMQGEMDYMHRHGTKRSRPDELLPGTVRIISVRMNYLPPDAQDPFQVLEDASLAYISRYALGRDYHKVMRKRLQKLAYRIEQQVGSFGYRAFVDSAPVLEKALAHKAGLGWIGKHTNLLSEDAGSWFFLGELFTNLPLPVDDPSLSHCGTCEACIDICPTQAIVAPYKLDARKCISYLTIEHKTSIPIEYRKPMGNRIYGCDDCQLVCPWNKFSKKSPLADFAKRHELDATRLVELFSWTEKDFLYFTEGSAIRRIGYQQWLRNVAVALGNAPSIPEVVDALVIRQDDCSELVREHVQWALQQHGQ